MGGRDEALTDKISGKLSSVPATEFVERELARELTLLEAVTLGVGGIIGGGLFSMIGIIIGLAGPAVTLSFLFITLVVATVGYNYVRLAGRYPSSGASYEYVARAFPRSGWMKVWVGYSLWFAYIVACAFYSVSFGFYASNMFPVFPPQLYTTVLVVAFLALNVRGVAKTGGAQNILVLAKVGILMLFVLFALPSVDVGNFDPFFPRNPLNIFTASALIFVGYQGFEIIGTSGEELKNPERNIGRAIYISLGIVSIIYLAVAFVATGLGPHHGFEESEAPMARLASVSLGKSGELLLGLGALLATSSAFNAALFGSSRLAYAMSREGTMPHWFSSLSKARRVPVFSLLAASLLIVTIASLGVLKELAALASLIFLVIFFVVSLSNFRLRKETGSNALFPGLAMILCLSLILFVEPTVWPWFILLLAFVLVTYELRKRMTRRGTPAYENSKVVY